MQLLTVDLLKSLLKFPRSYQKYRFALTFKGNPSVKRFQTTWTTLTFFIRMEIKQLLNKIWTEGQRFANGFAHSFSMRILSISWPRDLFGSRFLIIYSTSFISKVRDDKDSIDYLRHFDGLLLLLFISVYCLEKWILKISAFCLKIQ